MVATIRSGEKMSKRSVLAYAGKKPMTNATMQARQEKRHVARVEQWKLKEQTKPPLPRCRLISETELADAEEWLRKHSGVRNNPLLAAIKR